MKILVACEESQEVCKAFRNKGHEAYSCDIQECSGGHPEWHIKDDVKKVLDQHWDMIIAFPPCTYMSAAGARWMHQNGSINQDRYKSMLAAREFFMLFYNHPCKKIAIENPKPLKIVNLPDPGHYIEPYQFGSPYSKKTYLWLKGLPPLMSTDIIQNYVPFLPSNTGGKKRGQKSFIGIAHDPISAAKTFPGVAAAMADQWG